MNLRPFDQGLQAMRQGNIDEGRRLLRIALRDDPLNATERAAAWLWLAHHADSPGEQRRCYEEALKADPSNTELRSRYEVFMQSHLFPPTSALGIGGGSATPPPPNTLPGQEPPRPAGSSGPYLRNDPHVPTGSTQPFSPVNVQEVAMTGRLYTPTAPVSPASAFSLGGVAPGSTVVPAILGGPNGVGSGFFLTRDGLLATSRYVVGGMQRVTVALPNGQQEQGHVVRSFPEYDLAFVYAQLPVEQTIRVTPQMALPPGALLNVISYRSQVVQGRSRASRRPLPPQWFATDIAGLADAGGGPVLDEQHYQVGMMTHNRSARVNDLYGLSIHAIRSLLDHFLRELQDGAKVYCFHCGHYSRALTAGGYYCESCGGMSQQAQRIVRFPQAHLGGFYAVNDRRVCPHCQARVGANQRDQTCLRCGQKMG